MMTMLVRWSLLLLLGLEMLMLLLLLLLLRVVMNIRARHRRPSEIEDKARAASRVSSRWAGRRLRGLMIVAG
jgi:hypothetical protein